MSGTGDLVGDGPGVAGHGGRVLVDLVEEQPQGAGDGAGGGLVEGDGDGGGGVGDGSGEAADYGLAGDGAVFVVVSQVGVEVVREPVLGVMGEESQDHLQGGVRPCAGAVVTGCALPVRPDGWLVLAVTWVIARGPPWS